MKTTVILEELRLSAIKPSEVYDEYAEFLRRDLAALFAESEIAWHERACPGCGAERVAEAFTKEGLRYRDCPTCRTLFVSPVPEQAALDRLAAEGRAGSFRRNLFSAELAKERHRHVHQAMLDWIIQIRDEHDIDTASYCHLGGEDSGWIELVTEKELFGEITIVAPVGGSTGPVRAKVVESLAQTPGPYSVVSTFTTLDKVSDPVDLLNGMAKRLKLGGVLFLTTSSSSGLEHQLLGPDAPSLLALDRLTVFSVEALRDRVERMGFDVLELSTPGRLDVEVVARYVQENPSGREIPFWSHVFSRKDQRLMAALQLFLQENLLCSYARVAARKSLDPAAS